jgi:hypothetical protein
LNNALLEEISSQDESKTMKKLEQMEVGPKSMDQIPAKMTNPHLPLGRGLDPNLDQVPSQLACISVRARAHVSGISITRKQTSACKRTCQTKLTCQLCGQLPLLMEHPQRPEHLPTSNLGPAIKMTGYSKLYEVNLSSNRMTSHGPKRVHRVHA